MNRREYPGKDTPVYADNDDDKCDLMTSEQNHKCQSVHVHMFSHVTAKTILSLSRVYACDKFFLQSVGMHSVLNNLIIMHASIRIVL